jgi:hypothetical protein
MRTRWRLVAVALLVFSPRGAGAIIAITACGAIVPEREVGLLAADLACTENANSVTLLNRATLDLAGHTLTHGGGPAAVRCDSSRCAVLSSAPGGTLVTATTAIIGNRVDVSDCAIDVTNTTTSGDVINAFKINATNVRVTNATSSAFLGLKIRATNLELVDCWVGVTALSRFRGDLVTVTGGGYGIIAANRARVTGLTIHGADYDGVRGRSVTLLDSDVTGNATIGGADLDTARRPTLLNTLCGTSLVLADPPTTATWGVCQND